MSVFDVVSVAFAACTVASVRTSPAVLETASDVETSELPEVLVDVPEELEALLPPDVLEPLEDAPVFDELSLHADQLPVPVLPSVNVPVPMPVKRFVPSEPMLSVVPSFLLALPATM